MRDVLEGKNTNSHHEDREMPVENVVGSSQIIALF